MAKRLRNQTQLVISYTSTRFMDLALSKIHCFMIRNETVENTFGSPILLFIIDNYYYYYLFVKLLLASIHMIPMGRWPHKRENCHQARSSIVNLIIPHRHICQTKLSVLEWHWCGAGSL
jgi:hypothetical protein